MTVLIPKRFSVAAMRPPMPHTSSGGRDSKRRIASIALRRHTPLALGSRLPSSFATSEPSLQRVFEVEIPMELYERVVAEVGTDKMARLEFGFHFQEICEEKYPELDTIIHKTIEQWIQTHNLGDTPAYWMHFYRLQSPWFE